MQEYNVSNNKNKKETSTYIKPTINVYSITTIRQALNPAIGFSGGRIDEEADLLGLFDE